MSERAAIDPRGHLTYVGLAAFVAVLWLAMLPSRPLFNPDEGRYAEISREMLSGSDWVIPHLNGLAYIEKPPLQYWATALSLRLFGINEFAARLYTALCALGTLVVVWSYADRSAGRAAAWRASAMLASLSLFVVLGQLLTLDMSLTFFMTLALTAFLRVQQPRWTQHPRRAQGWMLVAWAATACGVLTKGLVAAAIPAAVLVIYSLWTRDGSPWRRLYASRGLPLFLAIAVPWHWLAAQRLPDFLEFYFVHEHVARYLTPSADREEPAWFFVAVFVVGTIPWTLSGLRAVGTGWRRRSPRGEFDVARFLWIWGGFVCVFFSTSDSKLIPYILPALPALALLIGTSPESVLRREVSFAASFTLLAAVAVAATSLYGPRYLAADARGQYFSMLARPLAQIAALLGASGLFVLLRRRRDLNRATLFLSAGWCLTGLMLMRAASAVAPVYSGVVLARALHSIARDTPLYSVGTYDQTLPFYWRRTFALVAYRGELDFGLRHDPVEIPTLSEFVSQWQHVPEGYAVMDRSLYEDLGRREVPMREVAHDVHRVLVARR